MNDPMSRKLFQDRQAREKLRGMGGIMASSPELAQTVAKFQDGGGVTVPIVGRTPFNVIAQRVPGMSQQEMTAAGLPRAGLPRREIIEIMERVDPNIGPEEFAAMSREERRAAGFSNLGALNNAYFATRERLLESQFPLQGPPMPPEPEAVLPLGNYINPVDEFSVLTDVFTLPEMVVDRASEEDEMSRLAREDAERIAAEREAAGITDARDSFGARFAASEELRPLLSSQMEQESRGRTAQEQRAVRAQAEAAAERNEAEAVAADAERARLEAARRAAEELADTGGPEGEGGFDFDTSFEQAEARLRRVMGDAGGNEESRKKAMANLAMIGLAIAAGQSPDALTNIAQGALAGTQAIRTEKAEREREERALRMAAFDTAIRQQEAEAARQATAARDQLAFERNVRLEEVKAGLRPAGADGMLDIPPLARIYGDVQQAAITRFNDPTGGRPPDALEGDTATTYADRLATQASNLAQLRNPQVYGEATWLRSQIDQFLEQATESGEVSLDAAKTRLRGILMQQYPGVNLEAYGL